MEHLQGLEIIRTGDVTDTRRLTICLQVSGQSLNIAIDHGQSDPRSAESHAFSAPNLEHLPRCIESNRQRLTHTMTGIGRSHGDHELPDTPGQLQSEFCTENINSLSRSTFMAKDSNRNDTEPIGKISR